MIASMLIGIIITVLVFLSLLGFIYAYGKHAIEPSPSKAELPPKTFNSLQFGADHTVEARVMFKDRPASTANKMFGYIFWGLMLGQVVIGLVIVIQGNAQLVPDGNCPEGLVNIYSLPAEDVAAMEEAGFDMPDIQDLMPPGMPAYCVSGEFHTSYHQCMKNADGLPTPSPEEMLSGLAGNAGMNVPADCSIQTENLNTCLLQNNNDPDGTRCTPYAQALNDCQLNGFRRLQVGKPLQHGRILMERASDGNMVATIQHDMISALYMHQFRSMTGRPLRRLQEIVEGETTEGEPINLWGAFEEYMQVPAVIFTCLLLSVPLWLFVLKTCTAGVVWGVLALNLIALIFMIVRPLMLQKEVDDNLQQVGMGELSDAMGTSDPKPNYFVCVVAVGYIGLVAFMRKKIATAIEIIKIATTGLVETPSVFGASTVCFLMYGTYIAFWEISVISSSGALALTDKTGDPEPMMEMERCHLGVPGHIEGMIRFLIICFVPTTFFFFNATMCCCATGLGAWYFHQDDPQRPRSPAFVGLKWAFFDSTGPVFLASLIQYAVHEIKKLIKKKPNPCNPIWLIVRIIWCFIEAAVEAFTKMMLLGHLFHGGGLIPTCRNAYAVLKNHLGQVLVTDMVSVQVVNWSLIAFSVGFGVASCAWMDTMVGAGLFAGGVEGLSDMGVPADVIAILVCGTFLFFASYPLFSLVVVIGFCQGLISGLGKNHVIGLLTGIFFSSITSIIFNFVGKIVHNSTDVIMYCLALEMETGKDQERLGNLYKVMKDQIPTGETNAGAVAQGKEVAPGQASSPAQA